LACLNLNLEILTQWVVSLILLNGRVNQGQGPYQSSTRQFRALTRHDLKNTRQCVGNYIVGPSGVLDAKFKRGQSQHPPAKPTYVFNPLEKPAEGQVIAVEFKLLMFEITSALLTAE